MESDKVDSVTNPESTTAQPPKKTMFDYLISSGPLEFEAQARLNQRKQEEARKAKSKS